MLFSAPLFSHDLCQAHPFLILRLYKKFVHISYSKPALYNRYLTSKCTDTLEKYNIRVWSYNLGYPKLLSNLCVFVLVLCILPPFIYVLWATVNHIRLFMMKVTARLQFKNTGWIARTFYILVLYSFAALELKNSFRGGKSGSLPLMHKILYLLKLFYTLKIIYRFQFLLDFKNNKIQIKYIKLKTILTYNASLYSIFWIERQTLNEKIKLKSYRISFITLYLYLNFI